MSLINQYHYHDDSPYWNCDLLLKMTDESEPFKQKKG